MAYLARKQYRVVPLPDLVAMIRNKNNISGCVAITFDDGYDDFCTNALPILQKYRFPATIFLATGLLESVRHTTEGSGIPLMKKNEARRVCKANGIHCMPHTVSHPDLRKISIQEGIDEIEQSRVDTENISGARAPIFAYPKGKYTKEVVVYMRRHGSWEAAVTVMPGLVDIQSDLFLLPRNAVDSKTTLTQFKGKVSGAIALYVKLKYVCKREI